MWFIIVYIWPLFLRRAHKLYHLTSNCFKNNIFWNHNQDTLGLESLDVIGIYALDLSQILSFASQRPPWG